MSTKGGTKGGTKGTKTSETKTTTPTDKKEDDTNSVTSKKSQQDEQKRSQAATPRSEKARSEPRTPREQKEKTPSRHNKIYKTPPTPPPPVLQEKEKGFTLDCKAVSSISNDYSKANPKLGPVVPPFNSQRDKHSSSYFTFYGVDRTLEKTEQAPPGCSIDGPVMDRFHTDGAGYQYISRRNQFGAGHSPETVDGHAQFMQGIKPAIGYNGKYGYRRNAPWLRQNASPFGTASTSPTH